MLSSLHIENIAVIKRIDIDFNRGFMALTGETGAGKSVIIDSISLLLGAKADKELIRHGESSCFVSGLFTDLSSHTADTLVELGFDAEAGGELLIQRSFSLDGRSSVKLNGRSVTLSVLKSLAPSLISIHGQSDTNSLQDPVSHMRVIDVFCVDTGLKSRYSELYTRLCDIRSSIKEISEKEQERERLKEILSYQVKDIDSLKLTPGEEEALVDKKLKIKNNEKITKNSEFVYKALKGSEKGSVYHLVDRSVTALTQLSGIIPAYSGYAERLRDMLYQVEDIAEEVYAVIDEQEGDPTEALNAIESRLDKISKMKRKYGYTVEDILAFRDKAKAELDTLENSEEILIKLKEEEQVAYRDALSVAEKIHQLRVDGARSLDGSVKQTLEFLDMPKVQFYTKIEEHYTGGIKELNPDGSDTVEFYISANLGAEAQSISKIASGGELARIMLALKGVIADRDGVSTVVFDEIDAGVSGKTARKIGIKMRDLAKRTQIFSVTHSAQIASVANEHYLISKSDESGATETTIRPLDYEGRVKELSRILGGINVTDAQRRAAIDMLGDSEG